MKLLSAVQPYTYLIKWAFMVILAASLFIGGCNYGRAKQEATIVRLEQDKALLQEANASWVAAADERKKQVEDNAAEAERIRKLAEADAVELEKSSKDTEIVITENQVALETALRNPKCNELLELHVCPTVPLP